MSEPQNESQGVCTILTKSFTDRVKILGSQNTGDFWDVGNFYRCRLQISRNFGSAILANLPTTVPVCLLNNAKSLVGMTDLKIKATFGGIGNFYCCRLQILANLSGKHFGWNGKWWCFLSKWLFEFGPESKFPHS